MFTIKTNKWCQSFHITLCKKVSKRISQNARQLCGASSHVDHVHKSYQYTLTSFFFPVNMQSCWMLLPLVWVSMTTLTLCQSGDWGSGFDIDSTVMFANNTTQVIGDEPERRRDNHDWITSTAFSPSPSPTLPYQPQPDQCSVHFSTNTASARRLKAQQEELAYLQAIQHGNKAVIENLVQFVGAELGNQSYEDVIKENVIGIQEDQKSCHEVVEKAEEDLEKQLEGEASAALAGMQK